MPAFKNFKPTIELTIRQSAGDSLDSLDSAAAALEKAPVLAVAQLHGTARRLGVNLAGYSDIAVFA